MIQRLLRLATLVLFFAALARADDKPPRIPPNQARKHVGKQVEVVFEVKAAKHSVKRKTVFLDSEADFHDEKNLGVAISEKGIADLKTRRGIDSPAEFYKGKSVRVLGEVRLENDRPYIDVHDAEHLFEAQGL